MNKKNRHANLLTKTLFGSLVLSVLFAGICIFQYFSYQKEIESTALSLSEDRLVLIRQALLEDHTLLDKPTNYSFEAVDYNAQEQYIVFTQKGSSSVKLLFPDALDRLSFVSQLQPGTIQQTTVNTSEGQFYVSGTIMELNGHHFALIYYLEQSSIQNLNAFFRSQGLWLASALLMAVIFVLVSSYLAWKADQALKEVEDAHQEQKMINKRMQILAKEGEAAGEVRANLWQEDMLKVFLERIQKRKISPCTLVELEFASRKERYEFIHRSALYFNPYILRFVVGSRYMALIFIHYDDEQARTILSNSNVKSSCIKKIEKIETA